MKAKVLWLITLLFSSTFLYAEAINNTQMIVRFTSAPAHHDEVTVQLKQLSKIVGVHLELRHPMALGAYVIDIAPAEQQRLHAHTPAEQQALRRQIVQQLKKLPQVNLAEADGIFLAPPEDEITGRLRTYSPDRSTQWDMLDDSIYSIKADNMVWAITRGNPNITIGIVDTGSCNTPALTGTFVGGYDFVVPQADPISLNGNGHGCGVAGIIAMHTTALSNAQGIAPEIKLEALNPFGTHDSATFSDIADAIEWGIGKTVPGLPANPHPVNAINMSLGTELSGGALQECAEVAQEALADAYQANVAVTVSGGNENIDASNRVMARCNHVIAVGGTTPDGVRVGYSNFGTTIAIAAPADPAYPSTAEGGYGSFGATSGASPHVAGTIALMLSINPQLSVSEVIRILQSTATPFATAQSPTIGAGIVNALAAVTDVAKPFIVTVPSVAELQLSHYPDPFHSCGQDFIPTATNIAFSTVLFSNAWQIDSTPKPSCQPLGAYQTPTLTSSGQVITVHYGATTYHFMAPENTSCKLISNTESLCTIIFH